MSASRSSTFQFHVVVVSGEFTVFSQNRVQQRSPSEQLVDIPSSRRGLYGSLPEQGTTAHTVEQIVDIPSGGVCGPGSSSAAAAADEDFTGVFSHVSSSTPVAQPVTWWGSLTPAQWAELEQARAEARREHVSKSKRKRKKKRKKRLPKSCARHPLRSGFGFLPYFLRVGLGS